MGKGGGRSAPAPAPSSQTVTQTSIPEYARPYVESMLGKSEALTDINQNPYQNYGGQRIADFNQNQQNAFANVFSQAPASQLGSATNLAGQAGLGAIGMQGQAGQLGQEALGYGATGQLYGGMGAQQALQRAQQTARQAGMYGGMGAGYGARGVQAAEQGFGAGEQFARQATDPNAIQAYMSPYMQNAVDFQKSEAVRDFNIGQQAQKARAVGAGAFGGSRQAIAEAEAQRNLGTQLAGIQATGTQKAFEDAQRQQQFGANLGLQGLQAGYGGLGVGMQGAGLGLQGVGAQQAAGQLGLQGTAQGMQGAGYGLQGVQAATGAGQLGLQGLGQATSAASTLGQLGQTQFGQEQAISAERQKVGAIQQAQAQQALDLSYQDFLKQRNYPYQQLAFQSDMLRGLPLSQSAQQFYSAPPSMGSQLGGLGMSALGIYGMSGGFKAKGGMVGKGYAEGGKVGYATGGNIKMMKTEQLEQLLENPGLTPLESDMVEKELMVRRRMEMNPESDQIMAGITAIPTGEMVPEQMAGGGIVAFKDGGDTERKAFQKLLEQQVRKDLEDQANAKPFTRSEQQMAGIEAEMKARREQAPYLALAKAGLGTLAGTSQYGLTNLGLGGIEGMKSYAKSKADEELGRRQMLQQQVEAEKAELARRSALQSARTTALTQSYNKDADLERAQIAKAQLGQGRETQNLIAAQRVFDNALKAEKTNLFQQNKARFNMDYTSPELDAEATANVMKRLTPGIKNMLFPEGMINPAAPAVPAPAAPAAAGKTFNVVVNGKTFSFPNKEAADTFKKRAKESDPKATIQ